VKVEIGADARADLFAILDGVIEGTGSFDLGERLIGELEAYCLQLGQHPFMGRPREDLGSGIRLITRNRRATIIYRVEDTRVFVQRIFYGGQNYEAALRDT